MPLYPLSKDSAALETFCAESQTNGFICDTYLYPALARDRYRESSKKYYWHVHQNAVLNEFQEFAFVNTEGFHVATDYELESLDATGIVINSLAGSLDNWCKPYPNFSLLLPITNSTMTEVSGFDHMAFLTDNSMSFVDVLEANLPMVNAPITAEGFCPAEECEKVASDGYCKCDS